MEGSTDQEIILDEWKALSLTNPKDESMMEINKGVADDFVENWTSCCLFGKLLSGQSH